jgi:polyferredoxin
MEMQEQPEITLVAARISTEFPAQSKVAAKLKKKLVRRTDRDYSQITRRSFQISFLLLNVWIGTLFYFWVRQFEPGGRPTSFDRPAGVEGWLPIAGLMNLRYFVLSHRVPDLHPAGMFLFVTFLGISFLFRKAFCSWLCPVGTISEYLWRAGRKLFGRNFHLPRWLDLALRGLKYLLLGFFVWAVNSMAADELAAFMRSPYGVIADVKMLNFFRHMGETAAIVVGILIIASVFIQNFWCRYLCPYGALFGLVSLLSPARIRRNAEACIDCAKCAKACPSALPVDKLVTIRSAECTGCLECVAVCPASETLNLALPNIGDRKARNIPVWAMAAGIILLFFGITGVAKVTRHWNSQVPRAVYQQLVPNADQALHPMPGENQ